MGLGPPQGYQATSLANPSAIATGPLALAFNVQRDFGAVGDGVADDTTALQNFTDAVGSSGSGYLPAGTYAITSIPIFESTAQYLFDPGAILVLNGAPQQRVSYYHPKGTEINVLQETFASGSTESTTGTITANSSQLTLAAAKDFRIGQGIAIMHAGPLPSISSPASPTVTPKGTTGSTAYTYYIAAVDDLGGVTAASSAGATSTGNASLDSTNYNALSWTAISNAFAYIIWGDSSNPATSQGFLAVVGTTSYNDEGNGNSTNGGNADVTAPPWSPTMPPSSALGEYLLTTIKAISGTAVTLTDATTSGVTDAWIGHDDTVAVNAALSASDAYRGIVRALGVFSLWDKITLPNNVALLGLDRMPEISAENLGISQYFPALWLRGLDGPPINFTAGIGGSIAGFVLYWPDQIDTNPPIPYGAAATLPNNGYDISIENIYCVNAYQMVAAEQSHGRLTISNVTGWVLDQFALIDGSVDVDRVRNIRINRVWPKGATDSSPSYVYAYNNATHLYLGRADGLQVSNFFSFGAVHGIVFVNSTYVSGATGTTYGQFTNIEIDGSSNAPIVIYDYNGIGLVFTNLMTATGSQAGVWVDSQCDEPYGTIEFHGWRSWAASRALVHNANTTVEIHGGLFDYINVGMLFIPSNGTTAKLRLYGGKFHNQSTGTNDFGLEGASGSIQDIATFGSTFTGSSPTPAISNTGSGTLTLKVHPISSPGIQTAPSIPAASTAIVNPFHFTVEVIVTGGSGVNVGIGNTSSTTATGLSSGAVTLAAGQYISLGAYSAAPSWVWNGL